MRASRSRAVLGLVVLTFAVLGHGQLARADEVPPSVTLADGPSHSLTQRLVAFASATRVVSVVNGDYGVWTATSTTGDSDIVMPQVGYWPLVISRPELSPDLAGDMIASGDLVKGTVRYQRIGGGGGTDTAKGRFVSAAPNGWLVDGGDEVEAGTGTVTHLADLQRTSGGRLTDMAAADEKHAVWSWLDSGERRFTVVDLQTSAVQQFHLPATDCDVSTGLPYVLCLREYYDLAGNGFVWYDPDVHAVHRLSFDTGNVTTTPAPGLVEDGSFGSNEVRATNQATGWTWTQGATTWFSTVPAAGGTVSSRATGRPLLAADDNQFWIDLGNGLYSMTNAGSVPVLHAADPPVAVRAVGGPTPTVGRVAWIDDEVGDDTVWDRTTDGSTILGPQRELSPDALTSGTIVSGRRTVYGQGVGNHPATLETLGSFPSKTSLPLSPSIAGMSGTRAVLGPLGGGPGVWTVLDLVTGKRRDFSANAMAIWGDHVLYEGSDRRLYWQDLTLPDTARVDVADVSASTVYSHLLVGGDEIAWFESYCGTTGPCRDVWTMRDMNSLDAATELPASTYLWSLTDSYAVATTAPQTLSARTLPSGAWTTVTTHASNVAGADANEVGFVALDDKGYPSMPTMAVLPDIGFTGQALGTSGVPTEVTRPVQTSWSGEIDVSRPLVTCRVDLTSDAGAVTSTPCRSDLMATGSAVFDWSLAGADALPVLDGTYTWRLVATDAHGDIRDEHGTAAPITGTVTVGPGTVHAVTQAPTSTSGGWITAFPADVHGITTSNLRLHDGTGARMPSTVTCFTAAGSRTGCGGWSRYAVVVPQAPLAAGGRYGLDVDPSGAAVPITTDDGAGVARSSTGLLVLRTADPASFAQRWAAAADARAIGGSTLVERRRGAQLTGSYSFAGKNAWLWFTSGPDHGKVDVRIDGTLVTTIDEYAASAAPRQRRTITAATAGWHTIQLVVTGTHRSGASGSLVSIDALTDPTTGTPVALTEHWAPATTAGRLAIATSTAQARVSTSFVGSHATLTRAGGPSESPAAVYVDGVRVATSTGYAVSPRLLVLSLRGFSGSKHVLTVIALPSARPSLALVSLTV